MQEQDLHSYWDAIERAACNMRSTPECPVHPGEIMVPELGSDRSDYRKLICPLCEQDKRNGGTAVQNQNGPHG